MSMKTWNSGLWTIPASCYSRFASMVIVPAPLPCQKPCKASCRIMVLSILLFTIDVQTFQMTLTNTMHMYPPPHLVMSTIKRT